MLLLEAVVGTKDKDLLDFLEDAFFYKSLATGHYLSLGAKEDNTKINEVFDSTKKRIVVQESVEEELLPEVKKVSLVDQLQNLLIED